MNTIKDYKKGIVILAAGASNRLGRSKQLLKYKGKTLLKRIIEEAKKSKADFVIVILGANYENHLRVIKNIDGINILHNKEWNKGMGNSLKFGLNQALIHYSNCNQIIFSVCDQPFLNFDSFNSLFDQFNKDGSPIIASKYANGYFGIPALFQNSKFNELLLLQDEKGAKNIIKNNLDQTSFVSFQKGNIDIDTEEDYNELLE